MDALGAGLPRRRWRRLLAAGVLLGSAATATAAVFEAGPLDYRERLRALQPGDELRLVPGRYRDGLPLHGLHGAPGRPIVIRGADSARPSVLLGDPGRNTISLRNTAHVVIRDLELDGRGAFVDAVKAEGDATYAHHIRLERLLIHNYGRHQQIVGISTKCPAWAWAIVDNRIIGGGTGIYLGDSDGSAPFVGGLIERNIVQDTMGYNLQIKHQLERPVLADFPRTTQRTLIRHNRFGKSRDASAGRAARPNVLIGHLPLSGPGRDDEYVVLGNYFLQNPHEALFQGEGNLTLIANVFVNTHDNGLPAVDIRPHNDIPRRVRVLFNTVVHRRLGIRIVPSRVGGDTGFEQIAAGNLIFADTGVAGGIHADNLVRPYAAFAAIPAGLEADPCIDALRVPVQGRAVELSQAGASAGLAADFHGNPRAPRERGACAAAPAREGAAASGRPRR